MDDAARILAAETLEDETFQKPDLTGQVWHDKELYGCTFVGAKLGELRMTGCKLEGCVFRDCDLTRMVPVRCGFRDVRFERCKLMGIDWSGLNPNPDLGFEDCLLKYSSFVGMKLRKTAFLRCVAVDANFIDVDLSEADFSGTDLGGATFQRANLTRANLADTRGALVVPEGNLVKGLRIPAESAILLAERYGMLVAG